MRCIIILFHSSVSAVAPTWNSPGETEEKHKKTVRIVCASGEIEIRNSQI
jgi:hypothetical protein